MNNNFNWTPGYTVNTTDKDVVTIWLLKFPNTEHTICKAEYVPEFKGWEVTHLGGLGRQHIIGGITDYHIVLTKANEFLQQCILSLHNVFVYAHVPIPFGGKQNGK